MKAYLDNSATTKPSAAVAAVVSEMLESGWYNPSALYKPALEIQKRIDPAEPRRITWRCWGT